MVIIVDNMHIPTSPIALAILCMLLVIIWYRKRNFSYVLCLLIFGSYVLYALDITLFPIAISGDTANAMRQNRRVSSFVNFILFNFDFSTHLVMRQMLQNILLTVPFGFGIHFLIKLRLKDMLWLTFMVGMSIEAAQIVISLLLRYPHRVIDINDVILNAIGVIVGYGLFRVFAWLYIWLTQAFGIRHWGLSAYIYTIAEQANQAN